MIQTTSFDSIVTDPYKKRAFIRSDFPGFREDYLVIHSLIRKYNVKRFLEIGTSSGMGTRVICNAMGMRGIPATLLLRQPEGIEVFSIDVPPGTDPLIIYPGKEDGHPAQAGRYCAYPYHQLFGDSTKFDFSPYYPLDAWFIDGKHNYEYAKKDTEQALKADPKLIIWHDIQIEEVEKAVEEVMTKRKHYEVKKVEGTRIAYAVKTKE